MIVCINKNGYFFIQNSEPEFLMENESISKIISNEEFRLNFLKEMKVASLTIGNLGLKVGDIYDTDGLKFKIPSLLDKDKEDWVYASYI